MIRDFRYVLELTWCTSNFGFPMIFRDGPNNGAERLYEPRYNLVETPYYPPDAETDEPGLPLLGDGGLDEPEGLILAMPRSETTSRTG